MEPQPPMQHSTARQAHPGALSQVSRACEACRAVKLKCLACPQGGACRRCSEFKRECVYRTGPRTRASRAAKTNTETAVPAPRTRQQTFSIDFQMPADDPIGPAFDNLVQDHAGYIETFLPEEPSFRNEAPFPSPPQSSMSSSAASHTTRTVQSLCMQPQFNLESATSLLDAFRHMLPYFPCILLGEGETVASLARARPFILLAILASVSGSRASQGHVLYDEEFRKVLALKVVAGGERSLELAQGLLIYCGWFPFHLRPKHRRAYQYLRMAVDMIRDLELDSSPSGSNAQSDVTPERVDGIRTYLSCYYVLIAFTSFWPKLSDTHAHIKSTAWISTCWTALPIASPHPQDQILAQLARHAYIIHEAGEANRKRHEDSDQLRLVMLGLEAQLRDWKLQIPSNIAPVRPVVLGGLFAEIFVYCAPLLKFPAPDTFAGALAPDVEKVRLAVPLLRRYFDEVAALGVRGFSALDWGRLIVCVILGMRLSFPVKGFLGWDDTWARAEIGFAEWLDTFCGGGAGEEDGGDGQERAGSALDISRAGHLIFDVVRKKYNERLERHVRLDDAVKPTCPLLDGSLDEYLRMWDGESGVGGFGVVDPSTVSMEPSSFGLGTGTWGGGLGTERGGSGGVNPGTQIYHDLWATMTMSWAEKESDSVSPGFYDDNTGPGFDSTRHEST